MKIKAPFRVQVQHFTGGRSKAFLFAFGLRHIHSHISRSEPWKTFTTTIWGYRNVGRLWRHNMGPC